VFWAIREIEWCFGGKGLSREKEDRRAGVGRKAIFILLKERRDHLKKKNENAGAPIQGRGKMKTRKKKKAYVRPKGDRGDVWDTTTGSLGKKGSPERKNTIFFSFSRHLCLLRGEKI